MSKTETAAAAMRDENQLVTFALGDEEFGFNIMSVQEIIRPPKMSRVPMTPDYLEGVANLRGMILPVIDTRTRFGMPKAEETDRTRVLVIDVDGVKTGLRVDWVKQVTRISRADEDAPPPVVKGISSDFLRGVVKMDGGKRMILDLDPKPICMVNLDLAAQKELGSAKSSPHQEIGVDSSGETTQIVSFRLGNEEYAFPMSKVQEILRFERPTVVPNVPVHVLGILTVRGNILPVIDLRLLLGLQSLHEELRGEASAWKSRIESNCQAIKAAFLIDGGNKIESQSGEGLLKWIASLNASNQGIISLLTKMRAGIEKAAKALHRAEHLSRGANSDALKAYQSEIEPGFNEILSLLGEFESSIAAAVHEDQRLVVINSGGQLLALVVDKVREVLNVSKTQIEEPPRIGVAQGYLSGIAKLNDSKRLIMLLEAQNFTKDESMKSLTRQAAAGEQDKKGEDKTGGESISGEQQFVTFRLAEEEYGIPIARIQEIDRYSKMTKIPCAPDYMEGICSLRGEIIPVINARHKFNLANKDADDRTRVIIMDVNGAKTGLMVDSVREVLNLSNQDISAPPGTVSSGISQQYISGIGKLDHGKRMIVLLDVEKILA